MVTLGFSRAQLGTHLGYFEDISGRFWRILNGHKTLTKEGLGWCRGTELNRRHADFQSLPAAFSQVPRLRGIALGPAWILPAKRIIDPSTLSTESIECCPVAPSLLPVLLRRSIDTRRQEVAVTFLRPTDTALFTLIRRQSFSRGWVPSQDSAWDPKMEFSDHAKG